MTDRSPQPDRRELVLSLFPGVDLLGRAFRDAGFCVVAGPDAILGDDVATFRGTPGRFDGIIGGPPCQDFSTLNRQREQQLSLASHGVRMLMEFLRIIDESQPEWFLIENVPGVPDVGLDGYQVQRLELTDAECGGTTLRIRHIQFGHRKGWIIRPNRLLDPPTRNLAPAAVGHYRSESTGKVSYPEHCRRQGLPGALKLPGFSRELKYQVVGNGVPLAMGRVLAEAVTRRGRRGKCDCPCDCGRPITGKQESASEACRQRLSRLGRGKLRRHQVTLAGVGHRVSGIDKAETRTPRPETRTFNGSKAQEGVWQKIINEIPPHDVYIEPFLGLGTILKKKRPAELSIGIEADEQVLREHWSNGDPVTNSAFETFLRHDDGLEWLKRRIGNGHEWNERAACGICDGIPQSEFAHSQRPRHSVGPWMVGEGTKPRRPCPRCGLRTFVYCDPPYLLESRRNPRRQLYRYEWSRADHVEFLKLVRRLPFLVMISSYDCDLYREHLADWRLVQFQAITRGGKQATECLWMNFPAVTELHDPRFVGENKRHRERIRRRAQTMAGKLDDLTPLERQAVLDHVSASLQAGTPWSR